MIISLLNLFFHSNLVHKNFNDYVSQKIVKVAAGDRTACAEPSTKNKRGKCHENLIKNTKSKINVSNNIFFHLLASSVQSTKLYIAITCLFNKQRP
jgi:hypothetical protein